MFRTLLAALGVSHSMAVESLNAKNFDEKIGAQNSIVKFLAPWCGHCTRMKPAWEECAKWAEEEVEGVRIFDVDCTVEKALCQKQGVRGYPTIKYWKDGVEGKYSSGRDAASIKKFVTSTLGSVKGGAADEEL